MRLLILGATGKTGQEVVRGALEAGHDVTAFVRNPAKLASRESKLRVVVGDVLSGDSLAAAVNNQDAVISTLGTAKGSEQLLARSTKVLVEAAASAGLRRVIMMSSFFMAPDYQPETAVKLLTGIFMKAIVSDKANSERLLRDSNLDWTIVYCVGLTNGPRTGRQRILGVAQAPSLKMKISRADVAAFLLSQLAGTSGIRKNLTIAAGSFSLS